MNAKLMAVVPGALLVGGVLIFGVGYGMASLANRDNHDHNYGKNVVAVVPADKETTLDVSYQRGEWLFSDDQSGEFTTVTGCEQEDDCVVKYHNGAWTITRVNH